MEIEQYNIFEKREGTNFDIAKVANILNRSYFSDQQISVALRNLYDLLSIEGYLLIIENRPEEQGGLYQKQNGKFNSA